MAEGFTKALFIILLLNFKHDLNLKKAKAERTCRRPDSKVDKI